MTLSTELKSLAEEFRIYAKAECLPESARWEKWADTCEAGAKALQMPEDRAGGTRPLQSDPDFIRHIGLQGTQDV